MDCVFPWYMKHRNRVFFYFGKGAFVVDNLKSVLLLCFSRVILYQRCRASISCASSSHNKPLPHCSHWSKLVNRNINFMVSEPFFQLFFLGHVQKYFADKIIWSIVGEVKVAKTIINLIHPSWVEYLWHVDTDLDFEDKKMNMEPPLSSKQMWYWLEKSTRCKYLSYKLFCANCSNRYGIN